MMQQVMLAPGKSTIALVINASSNTPYNIFTAAGSPSYSVDVTLQVTGNSTQGSNSTASAAVDTGTGWVAGSTITLTVDAGSTIVGMGGAAGPGAAAPAGNGDFAGTNGSLGGNALNMQWPVTITNNGVIGGGGGGGGGGYGEKVSTNSVAGGGGGGGAGGAGGALGAAGTGQVAGTAPTAGTAGNATTAGTHGNGGSKGSGCALAVGSTGGDGGGLGLAGANSPIAPSSTGGAPGNAVKRNANTLTGKADGTYADANWKGIVG